MNNKYYEPWNERTIKFQRQDDYPYVPFGEPHTFYYGSFVEHLVWWAVIAVGIWLWFRA